MSAVRAIAASLVASLGVLLGILLGILLGAAGAAAQPAAPDVSVLIGVAGRTLFVGSESMRPTLWRGDYPSGQPWIGAPDEDLRGRIVLFVRPRTTAVDWVSRVIGLPGERIGLRAGVVSIDGRPVAYAAAGSLQWAQDADQAPAPHRLLVEALPNGRHHRIMLAETGGFLRDVAEVTVPPGHVFVLSDNRDNAIDSRMATQFGTVPVASIRATVYAVAFSLDPEASLVERAAAAAFLASPPPWYPPRSAEQRREAERWRADTGWSRRLRLDRAQIATDAD